MAPKRDDPSDRRRAFDVENPTPNRHESTSEEVRSNRVDSPASRKRHGGDPNSPPRGPLNPDVSRPIQGCAFGPGGSVPAGSPAIVTIRTVLGARVCLPRAESVQSVRLRCSAPRSSRSDGPSGVNTKGPRTSAAIIARPYLRRATVEPQRLPKFLARVQIRAGLPTHRIRGVTTRRPKGLS